MNLMIVYYNISFWKITGKESFWKMSIMNRISGMYMTGKQSSVNIIGVLKKEKENKVEKYFKKWWPTISRIGWSNSISSVS